ncbi:hypothetical protein T440DRAFT_468608 [Plenodomus tracheiphilus IPT5]|uniref:Thioesterase domain-containing protein n=1 Tax=Plenodomus tracheiphilus IPT5 TaxID=1408161 RepID=A0A6A7B7K3_9PLEO|nr:hypothetical protein T440DRAFT_468608 [Plenodomus tracheiphilus IPT5]
MGASQDNKRAEEKILRWSELSRSESYDYHDSLPSKIMNLEEVTIAPTGEASAVFSFVVPKALCNSGGNLHGGAVALIFDITTSITIAAMSREGFWDGGNVSRTLNCTFLRPAAKGSKVFVETQVVHLGKQMGQITGVMRLDSKDGKVAYTCEHGKVNIGGSRL